MENIEDEVHSVKFQGILSLTLRSMPNLVFSKNEAGICFSTNSNNSQFFLLVLLL